MSKNRRAAKKQIPINLIRLLRRVPVELSFAGEPQKIFRVFS